VFLGEPHGFAPQSASMTTAVHTVVTYSYYFVALAFSPASLLQIQTNAAVGKVMTEIKRIKEESPVSAAACDFAESRFPASLPLDPTVPLPTPCLVLPRATATDTCSR
jgi:hypothetical protein